MGAVLAIVLGATLAAGTLPPPRTVAEQVFLRLDEARREAGAPEWERRAELDRLATLAAEEVASAGGRGLEHAIDDLLDESGVRGVTRVVPLVQSLKGYDRPAEVAVGQWKRYRQAWNDLMDPKIEAIGVGEARAADRMLVLVAVLVADVPPFDPPALELELERAVNELRIRHRLAPLERSEALAEVARGHSRDMAARDYFEHSSPEQEVVADRVRAAGVRYRKVGENLARVERSESPVSNAIEGWMSSPTHRANLLTPEFEEGGVGVAADSDGVIYFTQVYLEPPRKRREE
jgi:uncharacterized protein YkwD